MSTQLQNNNSANNKRIAKNTLMLYIRMLFSMFVSFYTSRILLSTLGITDFGINNVVGGVASMFSFLNSSLSGATSRFLTYELGCGDTQKIKDTFSAAFTIHVILSLLILLLCETIGIYLLEYKLVIPEDRMNAARVLFQVSTISTILSITQVPFSASIIAHEKMDIFAYFGIAETILKLAIVYLIMVSPLDKLISYSMLFFLVSLTMLIIYRWYAIKHFDECSMSLSNKRGIIMPMLKFSGWDLYGNMAVMLRGQGINILQNMFWGPAINAATGVANQILHAILGFSNNFITAIRPQIVKLYASGDIEEMQKLAEKGSKISFFLLYFISFPCLVEMPFVLDLWLTDAPEYAVQFSRWSIVFNWSITLFLPLVHIIHATGKVQRISIINGTLYILVLPITYLAYRFTNANPTLPFIVNASFALLGAGISNLYTVHLYIPEFQTRHFIIYSILRAILTIIVGSILPILVHLYLQHGWFDFFGTCITSVVCLSTSILLIGLTKGERKVIIDIIKKKIKI